MSNKENSSTHSNASTSIQRRDQVIVNPITTPLKPNSSQKPHDLNQNHNQILDDPPQPSQFESAQEPYLQQPNGWGGSWVLYTVMCLTTFVHIWDAAALTYQGPQPIFGNYAFRETIRETRRAKTLATYARKRGPLIFSSIEGMSPLESHGVTHLEDAFGGLISGPPKLWKHGEIYVHEFEKQYPKPGPMVITNFQLSPIHWNNGISNPCEDRVMFIGGEKIPKSPFDLEYVNRVRDPHQPNLNLNPDYEGDSPLFITVAFGFLRINCSKSQDQVQSGYLTILNSAVHGGNILGRVYLITGSFDNNTFPILKSQPSSCPNVTPVIDDPEQKSAALTCSQSAPTQQRMVDLSDTSVDWTDKSIYATDSPGAFISLNLTEIGSLIEKRGNGDPVHYQILTMIGLLPVLCWIFFAIRLNQVEIIMHMEIDGNKHRSTVSSSLLSTSPSSPPKSNSLASGSSINSSTGRTIIPRRSTSSNTTNQSRARQKSALEFKRREIRYTKFIDDRMIGCMWFSPLMHVGYIIALTWCWCIRLEDRGNVIHSFLPRFAHFQLNYVGMVVLLVSQECCSWCLSLTSSLLVRRHVMQDHQRALIHAYQFSPVRHVVKITNVLACLVLVGSVVFGRSAADGTTQPTLIFICALGCVTSEAMLIYQGLTRTPDTTRSTHELSPPRWCQVGGLTLGFSISTRGISNYLVSQDVHGMKKASTTSSPNEHESVARLGFSGKIADALMLGRSDLMLQGFFNGKNVQLELFEARLGDQVEGTTIDSTGGQQFLLSRHWIYHGRANFTCS